MADSRGDGTLMKAGAGGLQSGRARSGIMRELALGVIEFNC